MGALLNTLGIDSEIQKTLSKDILASEKIIMGMQKAYGMVTEEWQKDKLANVISESVRFLMLELNKGAMPKTTPIPEPENKPDYSNLPVKVGDKFINKADKKSSYIKGKNLVYLVSEIFTDSIKIEGQTNYGYKTGTLTFEKVIKGFESGELVLVKEKEKPKPKVKTTTNPKPPKPPKPTPTPKPPKPPKPKEETEDLSEYENMSQDELKDTMDELTEMLILLDKDEEEYEIIENEIKKVESLIKE